jgi:hypothetical protein
MHSQKAAALDFSLIFQPSVCSQIASFVVNAAQLYFDIYDAFSPDATRAWGYTVVIE